MSKIILEHDGIKVGDKVKYKEYYGYVAVINEIGFFLLRLENFNHHNALSDWSYDWYPELERKREKNCIWLYKGEFKVIKDELINKPTIMQTIIKKTKEAMDFLKRLKPEYHDLYLAGYIGKDLEYTQKYYDKMRELQAEYYRERITEIAKQEIKEAEEEEKKKK